MNLTTENFYIQKKGHWLRFYHSIADNKKVQQFVFQKCLSPEKIPKMKLKVQQQFEELLPQIPDFGNKRSNTFSTDMIKTALSLAFYRSFKAEGFQLQTIGQILYEIADVYHRSLNPLIRYIMRRPYFSSSFQKKIKKALENRKNSADPEDYQCTFIEGDQKNLLFGIDYTNCAGLNFLKHQNASELAPYLCLCDYPMYRAIKVGFNRAQNSAIGGTTCAFRFYRNYPSGGWPPEEVTEYKDFNLINKDERALRTVTLSHSFNIAQSQQNFSTVTKRSCKKRALIYCIFLLVLG